MVDTEMSLCYNIKLCVTSLVTSYLEEALRNIAMTYMDIPLKTKLE